MATTDVAVERIEGTMAGLDFTDAPPPSGPGCADCEAASPRGWWFHLRRCVECGHVGCCDTSPSQHATAHHRATGHRLIQSFEPGEDWFYDYATDAMAEGPDLPEPSSHPVDQPAPGPRDRLPADWVAQLNS